MSVHALRVVDQSPTGAAIRTTTLRLVAENVTLREVIEARVRQEVQAFNEGQEEVFAGLVQPVGTERVLNGYRVRKRQRLDADAQVARALEAFESNGFFVLVGDLQVVDLDAYIPVRDDLEFRFIKLVPLVGG